MSNILDKAINADSANAPKQLRAILLVENPLWKLPERRVARYLKRHLKARKNPIYEEIEADMDEETVFTMTTLAVADRELDASMLTDDVVDGKRETYADDNEALKTTPKAAKSLFCDGLQCAIS
jgi:hypothetical protein